MAVVEKPTDVIIAVFQEQEESLRNAEYPDIGITPKSVASSSIGWPIGDPDSRGAAIADRPNLVEEPGSTQAILPARCYQRTLSLPTEPAGGLSFAERLQAQLNSRDGNAQPDLPKPSSCAALTEPLLQPPSLGAKSATATFGDLGNRSEHGTDITSISRRDPSEWETFRVLRRELRRNASRVQKQASVALSAASSPPASPKRLKDSTGDIEEGRPSLPPTAVVQSSLMPATATESLVRRTKSMITLPRSRGSMVLADGQHLHPKHSLLSSLPAEQSLVAAGSIVSASPRKEKIPPVLQAAKRKVEQYVDMEAIAAATPRRHKDAGAASIGYDNEAKENKHYRLVATDESEGEEESNNSTADKAVPPLWKRLLQRMTGTVLIIKGVSWGIFFIVWSMHTTMPPVDLDVINLSLRGNLPLINGALQATLPSSLGACTSDSMHLAPKPCVGNSSLYYVRERVYEVNARWVSGLKTTKLDNIYLSVPQENRLALSIEGVIGELPLSLFVGQCVTPDTWFTGRCDKLWDNTDACCGTDKHFQVVLQSVCSEEYPFVRQITVENISVQQITIQEQFLGLISISLSDVTTTLQEALTKELQPFLMNNAFIPWGGQTLSLGELINKILALNINRDASGHERFECPKPPVGGFGPSQYEKQGVLERTFGGR
ncbi:hypothetical protein FOL47_009935 [Perkinsus chesapeaki]|uniref:Uncharacterized protein n=1 Tax=Perkinsus chesapeaki TaxID=330153 RepID=A0A7J6MQX1_PERCH|nr:hypothetical protein FOL47_009935 [Perkinsus chesapeaki]